MNTMHLIGAEQVERAGRNIDGAAETMNRAATSIDRSADVLARTMDEAVSRFAGNLAEHDAERPTLRDYFAAKAMVGIFQMIATGAHGVSASDIEGGIAQQAYNMADAMLKERQP